MALIPKNSIPNPPQSISDSSDDEDGARIYTPPETDSTDGPSSSTYLPDISHFGDIIQGLRNIKLSQVDADKSDASEQEVGKDLSANKKTRRSKAKKIVPADTAVSNVTDALQSLTVSNEGTTDHLEQERTNAKSAKNRREKERKKRRKAELAAEDANKDIDAANANDKSDYRIIKDAGYRSMKQFMDIHGLRLHDSEDIATAKTIIKDMWEMSLDKYQYPDNQAASVEEEEDEEEVPEKTVGYGAISNYKWLKDSEWDNIRDFMVAHGFDWHDFDDRTAAKELIERIKEDQAFEKQAKQPLPRMRNEVGYASATPKTAKTKKKTVVGLWEDYFGNETQLANWQRLCVDVGMEEIPSSITKCRKALGKVWVNIYDFLDAKAEGKPVKRYKSEQKLAMYTMKSGKIYPKKQAKQGGPARVLLAHIFGH
ncbi:hypothetical protein SBOR_4975 [Sclerotinia borealis F-4128]|uniref:Uncharacterized protein n=1 Tax=Sclerotinia borealis (strain F-4128) TaxID=1432307 RepID=W9CFE6_SCLBF|nr:hypothetical protein SBOR_4975 [Sclerotinia borealis F-4128]